jgi:2',3'-cyclic-nucleotide 2'-phosphodiesterase (5'-nucleotidase family)
MALCDQIIVLAHLDPLEIEILARRIPKSSIIVGGNNRAMEYPREIGQSLHVQTDAYGFHIGRLNLTLLKGSSGFKDILPANLTRKSLEETGRKLEISRDPEEIKTLHETREMLLEEERKLPDFGGKNTYEHFFIPIHPGMETDPEIENLISSSRDDLKRPLP